MDFVLVATLMAVLVAAGVVGVGVVVFGRWL
jgi:hypothetical protein